MKVTQFTNEYPPNVYGGAGVNVDYLSRELSKLCQVEVRCFEKPIVPDFTSKNLTLEKSLTASSFKGIDLSLLNTNPQFTSVFNALQKCLYFNSNNIHSDIIHCHTWYTHFAGILAKLLYNIPLVITSHSLEPLRTWKREQLQGGYDFSLWIEKTALEMADAIISVSQSMKKDILEHFSVKNEKIHVIYNGIDLNEYKKVNNPEILKKFKINPDKEFILFVGRITRQKGITHLLKAINRLEKDYQVVLCASSPDTPEIEAEFKLELENTRNLRKKIHPNNAHGEADIIWINEMISNEEKIALYSHSSLFCCPSIYEPFGIINLEAMACETPVIASAVGGIIEIIDHKFTGELIPINVDKNNIQAISNPENFEQNIADKINNLMNDKETRKKYAINGRQKVVDKFSWEAIAKQTLADRKSVV